MPKISKQAQLRAEIKRLQAEIAALEGDRNSRLMMRGIHQDVDSVKHMVRFLFAKAQGSEAGKAYEVLHDTLFPDVDKVRGEFHGYHGTEKPARKSRAKKHKKPGIRGK